MTVIIDLKGHGHIFLFILDYVTVGIKINTAPMIIDLEGHGGILFRMSDFAGVHVKIDTLWL